MKSLSRSAGIISLIGLALILSACGGGGGPAAENEAKVSQAFAVSGDVAVSISTYNGAIEVKTGGEGQVQVDVTKRGGGDTDAQAKTDLDNINLSLTQTAGKVNLVATHRGAPPNNSAASFVVTAPAGATIVATLDNGTVTISGVKGDVTVTTGNGEITMRGVEDGAISAKTTNGNVTLEGRNIAGLTASSSNGEVSFAGSIAANEEGNRIDVGNGSASISLPGDTQWGIDASTGNGQLTSDFAFQGDTTPTSVKGTVGASPTFGVRIRVQNGNVTIKKQ